MLNGAGRRVSLTRTPSRRSTHGLAIAVTVALSFASPVVFASPGTLAAQDRGLDILHEAAERYAAVETLCADFTQHLLIPLLGTERTGTGRLCQGRPNLFAMRFDDPEGDLIVVDGAVAWVYFPSSDAKTVLKTSADRSAGGRDFHREFLENPEQKYDVSYEDTEVVDGHATHRLRMRPKNPMSYRSAVVWIDDGNPVLRRIRLEEENGNVRTVTLADVGFDVDPGDGWFTFTPPPGAIVMER
jgi:outer membrane lipoprotein-sorting protein